MKRIKQLSSVVVSLLLVFSMIVPSFSIMTYAASYPTLSIDSKTSNERNDNTDRYKYIYTVEDLINIKNDLSANYVLKNDIDLLGIDWNPIGDKIDYNHKAQEFFETDGANYFTGTFDGNGFSIKNLTIKAAEQKQLEVGNYENDISEYGLFSHLSGAEVVNVNFENITLCIDVNTTATSVDKRHILSGAICGSSFASKIENCQLISGKIDAGDSSGSFVGAAHDTRIINCINYVSGSMLGGIAGTGGIFDGCINKGNLRNAAGGITSSISGNITNCINYGDISTSERVLGGICARANFSITKCANYGNIIQENTTGAITGGIAGCGSCNINYCSNNGSISTFLHHESGYITAQIGGILGESYSNSGQISNCINKGEINSYDTDGSSMGSLYIGGIIGYCGYSSDNRAKLDCKKIYNYGNINVSALEISTCIGGILGYTNGKELEIAKAYNYGDISINAHNLEGWVGGIVCEGDVCRMSCVANEGKIKVDADNIGYLYCGGLAGNLDAGSIITDSYNRGNCTVISSNTDENSRLGFGGIIEAVFDPNNTGTPIIIKNTYFCGDIGVADYRSIGTACSRNPKGVQINVENCYTTSTYLDKKTGTGDDCINGTVQTINNWTEQSEFNNFDFTNVWEMCDGISPTLKNNSIEYAASSTTLSIDSKTVNPGDEFTVAVKLQNAANSVYNGNFTLQYDSSKVEAVSYTYGSIFNDHIKNCNLNYQSKGNRIRFTFSGAYALKQDGTLVNITFRAKENVSGTAVLQFTAYKMYNENGVSIDTAVYHGNVTTAPKPVKTLTSVSIQTNPVKTTYHIGESLNTSGLVLKLTYSDGSTEIVSSGFTTSGFSSTSAGTKTVTVTYEGKTATFTVTVNTPTISLSSASKSMTVGDTETLTATTTPSGQAVTWTSSNTSVVTVSDGTVTATSAGTATITAKFTYNGITYSKTCSIMVTAPAPEPTPTSLAISSKPTKTTYEIGESLSTTGLKLKLTYSDGSSETVTSGFTTSGFSSATAGTKAVTVMYENLTTTFTVTVNEPEPDIDENAPQIVLESKKTTKGKEFTVAVTIKNNPGFSYLEVTPSYSSELTLVKVENGDLVSDFTKGKQYVWVSDEDITTDGVLLAFTFSVDDSVEVGNYQINFNVRTCANYDEESVSFNVVKANIKVLDCVYGDATGDGKIDGFDVIRLKKYLANYDYDTESSSVEATAGADANGDGKIDGFDVIRLKKYLANYDYETGESTVVLGPQ